MKRKIFSLLLIVALTLLWSSVGGCALRKRRPGSNTNAGIETAAPMPQISSFANDITDIPIPAELKWQRDESLAITTESFRGGVLIYTGRATILSLRDYMVAAMRDNQWRMVGETSSKNIMLAFVKPNKTCMMVLTESLFKKTELKLYIAIDNAGTSGMNPFGEVIPQ